MSAKNNLADAMQDHEDLRAHLSPGQNRELDEIANSGKRWITVSYGVVALMALALAALAFS